ncbi:DUF551 domain-containing protein [Escherichia coli]|nr:DUF551 domain-containing protein [Escherichia coli]EEY4087211.1 DUF551 domain-containing protein [Escherichia coli]EFN1850756.1 DUF551 domain-containing protein [Escherichia coli]EGK2867777.1 DUF551 domain-containing protein [Escherichia coli]EGK2940303.1 DUF551 domain-containing protein [Escherichia coli]
MSTITRENAEIKSFITGFLSDPAHDNQSSNSLLANVFRIALASLEAEPVAWKVTFTQIDREYNTFTGMYSDKAEVERWVRLHKACNFRAEITPLYAAPSAPVIPDGWISCSERMPDKLIPVMVMYEDGEMWSAMWNGNRWDDGTEYPDPHSVTHWREMPAEPPQEMK